MDTCVHGYLCVYGGGLYVCWHYVEVQILVCMCTNVNMKSCMNACMLACMLVEAACLSVCMYTYMNSISHVACVWLNACGCMDASMLVCIHICMPTCMHTWIGEGMLACTHIYVGMLYCVLDIHITYAGGWALAAVALHCPWLWHMPDAWQLLLPATLLHTT